MARDKGNFYEASDWFKEALQINQVLCLTSNSIVRDAKFSSTLPDVHLVLFDAGSPRRLVTDWEPSLGQTGVGTRSEEV